MENLELIKKKVFGWNYAVINQTTKEEELFTNKKDAIVYMANQKAGV